MKNFSILWFFISLTAFSQGTVDLSYYLPAGVLYNPAIPTPKEVIGHEVGAWHVTHDKLLNYMSKLAEVSDRIKWENRGTTYEDRPLPLLVITSPKNHQNLETIRKNHLAYTETDRAIDFENSPVIVYQGFSVHGDEPSGANAALAVAYYLAAAQGKEIEEILDKIVILLDPCYNPDGLQRFASWVNTHKSQPLTTDANDREHRQAWPSGRTNHYWFDVNRDWLPVQLPESQSRIETFHKWLPNILTDHHEMGAHSTFFFQPGEPNRVHPLTPALNQQLTREIAAYHAKALDKIGSLYFSEERYDDYYYGKGSTFPDINGGIGILFEQAGSDGHLRQTDNGLLSFPFTIRNQFTTALSTLEAAKNLKNKLLGYQQDFFKNARAEAAKNKTKAIIFGDEKDAAKTYHLAAILQRHHITFHEIAQDITLNGKSYKKGNTYMVPLQQKNSTLISAMFEKRTTFRDSLFYDISGWTFPLAFNVDYTELPSLTNLGAMVTNLQPPQGIITGKTNYAYLFEWHEYYTPRVLYQLLQKGIRARVGLTPFEVEGKRYDYGTIMIPAQNEELSEDNLYQFLKNIAEQNHLTIHAVSTGITKGIDLGSDDFKPLQLPKIALLVGEGVDAYDAGEVWHLLDQRYQTPVTKIDVSYLNRISLGKYNVFILCDMQTSTLDDAARNKLLEWVKNGGILIGYKNAASWLKNNQLIDIDIQKNTLTAKNISFEQRENLQGAQVTSGAIFEATIDRSHPICFGYKNPTLALFKSDNLYVSPHSQSYKNPIRYTVNPLLSGYISKENLKLLKSSVPFQAQRLGEGSVLVFTDNTNFRGFWYGTNKLLMNAIFFGKMM